MSTKSAIETQSQPSELETYFQQFRKHIVGVDQTFQSPYGQKKIIYKKPVLRDKIYTETLLSLNIARELVPQLRRAITPAKYDLEIHVDVGPLGPTRDMIKEVVGMVNGNGFKAKTKPDSWGASSVADKHT